MNKPGLRRAVTIVEVTIFAAVGAVIMSVLYQLFVGASRQGRDLDLKLKAVQGSQLLLERLERDLKHLVYEKDRYEVEVDEEGRRLRFYLFDGHQQDLSDGVIPIHQREYRFDPTTNRVTIDQVPYAPAYFRAVQFELTDIGQGKAKKPILTMRVGGVADEFDELPEGAIDLRTRADFVSSVGLAAVAAAHRQKLWWTALEIRERE